jgi:hypothetical protein
MIYYKEQRKCQCLKAEYKRNKMMIIINEDHKISIYNSIIPLKKIMYDNNILIIFF